MSTVTRQPGLIPDLRGYLTKRASMRKKLRRKLQRMADDDFPPYYEPPTSCMLVALPDELLLMVTETFSQSDLLSIGSTCRRLAAFAIPTLYIRDITEFDCLALRWACTFGICPTIERALAYGAPVDHIFHNESAMRCSWVLGGQIGAEDYDTPLKVAIGADEHEAVRLLCARGADVNRQDNWPAQFQREDRQYHHYPINLAMVSPFVEGPKHGGSARRTIRGNPRIIACLLDAGANPNQLPIDTWVSPGGPSHQTALGPAPLFMAMDAGVPADTVQLLLERGASTDLAGFDFGRWVRYVHHDSSADGVHTEAMRRLANQRLVDVTHTEAMVSAYGERGYSDIWISDWEKVQLLIAYGGVKDEVALNLHLQVPAMMPLLYGCLDFPEIVKLSNLFMAEGLRLASLSKEYGIPPIWAVLWWGESRINANSALATNHYRDAIQPRGSVFLNTISTIGATMRDLVTLMAESTLVDRRAGREVGSHGPAVRTSVIIDEIINDRIKVTARKKNQTPLRYVCSPSVFMGASSLIPLLLEFGADLNGADDEGITALHRAAMFTSEHHIRALVDFRGGPATSGLVIDPRDKGGWTPLHYACQFGFSDEHRDQAAAARVLLDNKADVHARTNSGRTALMIAIQSANRFAVELLLDFGATHDDLLAPSKADLWMYHNHFDAGNFIVFRNNLEERLGPLGEPLDRKTRRIRLDQELEMYVRRAGKHISMLLGSRCNQADQDHDDIWHSSPESPMTSEGGFPVTRPVTRDDRTDVKLHGIEMHGSSVHGSPESAMQSQGGSPISRDNRTDVELHGNEMHGSGFLWNRQPPYTIWWSTMDKVTSDLMDDTYLKAGNREIQVFGVFGDGDPLHQAFTLSSRWPEERAIDYLDLKELEKELLVPDFAVEVSDSD